MALDLDAISQQVCWVQKDKDASTLAWTLAADALPQAVAELRAAREVIASILADTELNVSMRTDIALDAYDELTGKAG